LGAFGDVLGDGREEGFARMAKAHLAEALQRPEKEVKMGPMAHSSTLGARLM
jgi:hypothetical protein